MALGRARAVALNGLAGRLVEVEADISAGLPAFALVGLPDTSLSEARDRVRAAAANSGVALPQQKITVNLSPGDLHKSGTGFDLAIAAALIAAADHVPADPVHGCVHVGELGLDGAVRPVRGVLPAVMAAVAAGHPRVVVPAANAAEAALVPGAVVVPVGHLGDVINVHRGDPVAAPQRAPGSPPAAPARPACADAEPDLRDVLGQPLARRAIEVAAAGGHHLLMSGPPGAGKTMLAARLPGLLPDLDDDQALEVTALHSLGGALPADAGLLRRPPYQDPHHTITTQGLVGGGNGALLPGAASLAHHGVLFLDEAPEFPARALEALRQPLEHGVLQLNRARSSARFPARFQLVLAANPCPCGRRFGKGLGCTCAPRDVARYQSKLSAPLLDRIDLQVEVSPVRRADVLAAAGGQGPESTAVVAARVAAARQRMRRRLRGTGYQRNADIPVAWLRRRLPLAAEAVVDLERAERTRSVSQRGLDRVLRTAWTVADLAGRSRPDRDDVAEALFLRGLQLAAR